MPWNETLLNRSWDQTMAIARWHSRRYRVRTRVRAIRVGRPTARIIGTNWQYVIECSPATCPCRVKYRG